MNLDQLHLPDFASWERETLNDFATEAYLKLQDQHELIQHLRHLVATAPEKNDDI